MWWRSRVEAAEYLPWEPREQGSRPPQPLYPDPIASLSVTYFNLVPTDGDTFFRLQLLPIILSFDIG